MKLDVLMDSRIVCFILRVVVHGNYLSSMMIFLSLNGSSHRNLTVLIEEFEQLKDQGANDVWGLLHCPCFCSSLLITFYWNKAFEWLLIVKFCIWLEIECYRLWRNIFIEWLRIEWMNGWMNYFVYAQVTGDSKSIISCTVIWC